MNEKHSFLRDTCMLPGGPGKRVRLTAKGVPRVFGLDSIPIVRTSV